MVVCASLMLGVKERAKLINEENRLVELRWETVRLKAKIESQSIPLLNAFEESTFFSPAAEKMRQGISAENAVLPLGKGIKGFDMFAKGLSGETLCDQIGNSEVFLRILNEEIAAAREKTQRLGRLYVGCGLMGGMGLCIIML